MEQQKQLGANEKYCESCGNIIKKRAAICPSCGVPINTVVVVGGRNRIIAALLAFFLGGFGVHKFYLGQTGKGILYLLFCWTFIPSILAFIEFILLLIMSDSEFNAKYNSYL